MENGAMVAGQSGPAGGGAVLPIEFRGTAAEYFGIWIVNLALTIVTLGIWSAWAKVRRKRYFLGNTYLDGHAFDYHAKGKQLLIGRLLVVGAVVGQNVIEDISIEAAGITGIAIFFAIPWVINRSLGFNARMTSWRNVRFNFRPAYWSAMGTLLLMPFVGIITLGLLWPVATRMGALYIARRHNFGTASFDADPRLASYYVAGLQALLVLLIGLLVLYPIAEVSMGALKPELLDSPGLAGIFLPFMLVIAGLVASEFYGALSRRIIVNALALHGGHKFSSDISGIQLAWIRVSNFIVQIVTLLLMRPWAAVREWRYNCGHIQARPAGDLGNFVDSARPAGGAFGSEYADIAGFDFGL